MSARTSHDSPLRIAAVHPGHAPGLLGITFCPGKKQHGAQTGSWDRDLDADLAVIAAWHAKAVVTLVEREELVAMAVPHLGEAVVAKGIRWFHLPIRDVSIPDSAWERHWRDAGRELRDMLMTGDRVLVHCKGGLGRAGVVAARLLIELGLSPDHAIAQVRAVRPGAIETPEQERYVKALAARVEVASVPARVALIAARPGLSLQDRLAGGLYGLLRAGPAQLDRFSGFISVGPAG